ncbi:hypothetical protein HYALB_00005740 [Hymenoscyphus albidus]|uniref:Uncharacterized protein n=1 Tax=Hymenoscyphus albidus TaxID=595503 RepID=A0A9N9PVB9_9HELO|nr:hypothetical protein HYALB_00005740 [Hymenoscyphus albidus]
MATTNRASVVRKQKWSALTVPKLITTELVESLTIREFGNHHPGSFTGTNTSYGGASDMSLPIDSLNCWGNWDTSKSTLGGISSSQGTGISRSNAADSDLQAQQPLTTTGDFMSAHGGYVTAQDSPEASIDTGDEGMDVPMESEMKKLLELTHSLYVQQRTLESAPWEEYLSSLSFTAGQKLAHNEDGAGKAIGGILSSSELYLMIITQFLIRTEARQSPSERNSSASSTSADVSLNGIEPGGNANWSIQSVVESEGSNIFSRHLSARHSTFTSSSSGHSFSPPLTRPPPNQLDTPTILLLLNCYNRLILIYATLFSRIRQYLSTSSPSLFSEASSHTLGDPSTKSKPQSLHIGGFSLGSYRRIQINILVDISIHFITRIQQVLGVPPQHTLHGGDSAERIELNGSPGTERGLFKVPQMRSLLETFLETVGLDDKEGTQDSACRVTDLKREFRELQRLPRW